MHSVSDGLVKLVMTVGYCWCVLDLTPLLQPTLITQNTNQVNKNQFIKFIPSLNETTLHDTTP